MPRKFAVEYIDRLLKGKDYDDLVDLSWAICSSPQFEVALPDYGLPAFAFTFAETLLWLAQSTRSGVFTYYEATPGTRQQAMTASLRALGADDFADWYQRGGRDWQDESKAKAIDDWLEANALVVQTWLRQLANQNRDAVLELT
jgi:hypothetical protein